MAVSRRNRAKEPSASSVASAGSGRAAFTPAAVAQNAAERPGLAGRGLSPAKQLALVVLLHLAIGSLYSGGLFFRHFRDAVPFSPIGHSVAFMPPGDQYEQLNRYTMAGHNLLRGRSPYYEGFQYNVSKSAPQFSEGWVFFPFSFMGGLLALVLGDAAAFNLLILLSYPLTGAIMYGLVRRLTGNPAAALLSSVLLATLPFRTAFLYGELLFGIDLCLLPLALWAFEYFLERRNTGAAALFGAATFCCLAATFQLAYYFFVFGALYFAVGAWQVRRDRTGRFGAPWGRLLGCLAPAGLYAVYLGRILAQSWKSSQPKSIQETYAYTPLPIDALRVFRGNERTVFLGLPLFLLIAVVAGWGLLGLWRSSTPAQKRVWCTVGPMFVLSYLFCFGPTLDSALKVPVYKTFFLYFPGASATRTPGRIMGAAGVAFAVLFGLACDFLWRRSARRRGRWRWAVTLVLAAVIVAQNDYIDPSFAVLDRGRNAVYESIRGTGGRVLALPFQSEPDHYLNATFIYYAQRYDLKMFNGHSSFYTQWAREATDRLYDISATGEISEAAWQWLKDNDYRYVIAHDTAFEPRIGVITLARLSSSRYLRLDGVADGIYKFAILPAPRTGGSQSAEELNRRLAAGARTGPPVLYFSGWYDREVYPGQKPFRWMKGTRSAVLVAGRVGQVKVEVRCPYEDLRISVDGQAVQFGLRKSEDGWSDVTLGLAATTKAYRVVELTTGRVYQVTTDRRQFGCMVGDVVAAPQ